VLDFARRYLGKFESGANGNTLSCNNFTVKDGFHMNVQEFTVGVPHPFQP
jgi:hypothetical protein